MRCYILCLLLFCSFIANGQSLAELERQLDSLLAKQQKSEVVLGLGYGNNPAYGGKVTDVNRPIVLKPFLSPSLYWYHKSGFYIGGSGYYLFNAEKKPWFELDLTTGYDYTKNDNILTGVSYTRYFFADSTDIPVTPIKNELYAYFYYRKWWLQPGISVDFGWGRQRIDRIRGYATISGSDFNVIAAVRHPFIFPGVISAKDAILFTPSVALTMGTANYFSQLRSFQYAARSPKLKKERKGQAKDLSFEDHSDFEPRIIDVTLNVSYLLGKFTISPLFTVFKPFTGYDQNVMCYFTGRVTYSF
ncbi:MAG TPA: hypothetical protein VM802_29325 [Chitinophaga sp.]|uniref:hypothetical protein n=1 Tax=Chitinophaga sp. TaxID=1869181 RepID=UPI002BF1B340|nr:hypothetical protein [Chitinophaga sp.]HVI49003.1 hypothetical protein [Chitinophaga sp.]